VGVWIAPVSPLEQSILVGSRVEWSLWIAEHSHSSMYLALLRSECTLSGRMVLFSYDALAACF
jgi:hypothetical protein